jgi:hypothetical protein
MVCPRCQTENPPAAAFCMRCALPLSAEGASSLGGATPSSYGTSSTVSLPLAAQQPPGSMPATYVAPPSQPLPPGYAAPASQPIPPDYAVPASQPVPPGYFTSPSQPIPPGYAAPPSQPVPPGYAPAPYYGYGAIPSQPLPAPPSQPTISGWMGGTPYGGLPTGMPSVPLVGAAPPWQQAHTRLQALLLRNLPAQRARNQWFTALAGALTSLVAGLGLTAVVQAIFAKSIVDAFKAAAGSSATAQFFSGIGASALTPDVLKLFALEQRVPLVFHLDLGLGELGSGSGDLTLTLPLTGLLLIPAVALVIGGYVAASADYERVPRYSVGYGALMGPIYGVLLAVLALFSSSNISAGAAGVSASLSVGPAFLPALLYGALWGTVFGALGGWIQLRGSRWLTTTWSALQSVRRRRLAAAVAGAGASALCALLFFIILSTALAAVAFIQASATGAPTGSPSTLGGLSAATGPLAVLLLVALLPALAVYALAFSTGAALESASTSSLPTGASQSSSISLITGHAALPVALYLLVLVPAISYFFGGRIAARMAGTTRASDGFITGALIAAPLSALLASLAWMVSFGVDESVAVASAGASVGPSVGGTFITVLIASALLGGLGGASTSVIVNLGGITRAGRVLIRIAGRPLIPLLDRLTRFPGTERRAAWREWIYDGMLIAAQLGALVIVLQIVDRTLAQLIPFGPLVLANDIAAALLIVLPALCFVGALFAALTTPGDMPAGASVAESQSPSGSSSIPRDPALIAVSAPWGMGAPGGEPPTWPNR